MATDYAFAGMSTSWAADCLSFRHDQGAEAPFLEVQPDEHHSCRAVTETQETRRDDQTTHQVSI